MQQVLFHVPLFKDSFPPDGLPVYGFGAMLFLTFVAVTWWGTRRAAKVGLGPERVQDLAIVLFISGIVGARDRRRWPRSTWCSPCRGRQGVVLPAPLQPQPGRARPR